MKSIDFAVVIRHLRDANQHWPLCTNHKPQTTNHKE